MDARIDNAGTRKRTAVLCAALAALAWTSAGAVTIHTWVDEAGVRHYADAPPAGAVRDSEAIELADTGAVNDAEDDYYSIVNQWQRMRDERDASDALALERERLRRDAHALAAAQDAAPPPGNQHYGGRYGGFPLLPYGIGRHGGHHGPRGGHAARGDRRRSSVVHATPPEWPRQRYFRQ